MLNCGLLSVAICHGLWGEDTETEGGHLSQVTKSPSYKEEGTRGNVTSGQGFLDRCVEGLTEVEGLVA